MSLRSDFCFVMSVTISCLIYAICVCFWHSGVQHILCCVFVLFFFVFYTQLRYSLDYPFLIVPSIFSNVQFSQLNICNEVFQFNTNYYQKYFRFSLYLVTTPVKIDKKNKYPSLFTRHPYNRNMDITCAYFPMTPIMVSYSTVVEIYFSFQSKLQMPGYGNNICERCPVCVSRTNHIHNSLLRQTLLYTSCMENDNLVCKILKCISS